MLECRWRQLSHLMRLVDAPGRQLPLVSSKTVPQDRPLILQTALEGFHMCFGSVQHVRVEAVELFRSVRNIGGDFNHVDISRLCRSHNLHQVISQPTRDQATLDLLITNLHSYYSEPIVQDPLANSDHRVVTMEPKNRTVTNKLVRRVCRPTPGSSLRYFGQWITSYQWSEVYKAPTTREKSQAMYSTLQSKINEFFPVKCVRLHHLDKPWMTPAIKSLLNARQQAYASNDLTTWKKLRNRIQRKIKKAKKVHYDGKIKSLKNEDIAQWHKAIKVMANMSRADPVIHVNGVSNGDHKATANEINKSLAAVIQSLPPIDISLLPPYLPSLPTPSVTPWDVLNRLRKVKTRKAAGPDGIPGKLIREFAYELSGPLSDILNCSLAQGIVPDEWKSAIVVPVPKTKPPSIDQIRPISLTSLLAKIAEGFITQWALSDILPQIDPQQFGCLKGRSTTHCLLDLTDHLYKASDKPGSLCSLVSTDYSKAFDRVSHTTAVTRLIELGLRPSLTRWIADFLTDRRQAVRYHGTLSDSVSITCGLPQGTLLGPLIFVAYINGAARQATAKRWKFVDDLNLLECRNPSSTPSSLQTDLSDLDKWSCENSMLLHPGKCKVLHVKFSRSAPIPPPLKINNRDLQQVEVMRILGVFLQSNLKWNAHVDYICTKSSQRLFFLRRLKHFHLDIEDLVSVYTTYIRPITEYATPVWHSGLTTSQSDRIERIQRRAVRIILGPDYSNYAEACSQLGLSTLHERREELTLKFARSLLTSGGDSKNPTGPGPGFEPTTSRAPVRHSNLSAKRSSDYRL
ncbi:hypothetical protein Bbelb_197360 [Branchiostoma belcheri]|nr:hypothetical protein Bbelb_197360 [Branchiostoma belcheri]